MLHALENEQNVDASCIKNIGKALTNSEDIKKKVW